MYITVPRSDVKKQTLLRRSVRPGVSVPIAVDADVLVFLLRVPRSSRLDIVQDVMIAPLDSLSSPEEVAVLQSEKAGTSVDRTKGISNERTKN